MASLYGIGLSGLSAARAGLTATANNITNVNTEGYSRERVELSTSVGKGVEVTGVQRVYARYLTEQLHNAQSQAVALATHRDQIAQIDNLLGNTDTGLGSQIQQFFASIRNVVASPSDIAARQSMLGAAKDVASRFNSLANYIEERESSVNSQLRDDVKQINQLAEQIDRLNDRIATAHARTQQPPNTLLDKRAQYVGQLHELVNVGVSHLDNGDLQITLAGRAIVDSSGAQQLVVTRSGSDPTGQPHVAYKTPSGEFRVIPDSRIDGGEVGGLLQFRNQSLVAARQGLNQLAHVFTARINDQHEEGTSLNGTTGQPLFTVDGFDGNGPKIKAAPGNSTGASLTASFTNVTSDPDGSAADKNSSEITAARYEFKYDDGALEITNLSTGESVTGIPGVDVTTSGLSDGDTFIVNPVAGAAQQISVAISDPAAIAAAANPSGGAGDNRNAQKLAALQNANVIEGNRSFNNDYARLVNEIGNITQHLQTSTDAQKALTQQLTKAQQSVSGVNLDEASVDLLRYQQMYRASAKVIQTASTVLDTLLSIRV